MKLDNNRDKQFYSIPDNQFNDRITEDRPFIDNAMESATLPNQTEHLYLIKNTGFSLTCKTIIGLQRVHVSTITK